ncbi:MAG: hypothetical protein Q4B05_03475 [Candidatus Saccharibacteria bacterium]|nr:hypothetical protein [Candidatus Saccharibacteria bacterium]
MSTSNLPGPDGIKTVGELGADDTTTSEQGGVTRRRLFRTVTVLSAIGVLEGAREWLRRAPAPAEASSQQGAAAEQADQAPGDHEQQEKLYERTERVFSGAKRLLETTIATAEAEGLPVGEMVTSKGDPVNELVSWEIDVGGVVVSVLTGVESFSYPENTNTQYRHLLAVSVKASEQVACTAVWTIRQSPNQEEVLSGAPKTLGELLACRASYDPVSIAFIADLNVVSSQGVAQGGQCSVVLSRVADPVAATGVEVHLSEELGASPSDFVDVTPTDAKVALAEAVWGLFSQQYQEAVKR